ncbi:MAG: NAD(P)-dependent oxidoreductase [Burkholderiaceae bacterium]|nr:NAD(P)-dependent oxidoreductase [Burkholderiaceae bacterium]
MKILVTGSSGHLGDALVRTLRAQGHDVVGLDIVPAVGTDVVGSIVDRALVARCMQGVDAVLHTATLHKPHVHSHGRQAFVDVNVSGTLNLLEAAATGQVRAFVFTSTTSTFGDALSPSPPAPAAWITEDVPPVPKNIYGATKVAAEDLCRLFHRNQGLPVVVLRTSRFFPEGDDDEHRRLGFDALNLKVVELLHRRVDLQDVVDAHLLAVQRAEQIGFDRFIISATSPFEPTDLDLLRGQASAVLRRVAPGFEPVFAARGWHMLEDIDRVYVNAHARQVLGWQPKYDFGRALADLAQGRDPRSPLTLAIGHKGYHPGRTDGGIYSTPTG